MGLRCGGGGEGCGDGPRLAPFRLGRALGGVAGVWEARESGVWCMRFSAEQRERMHTSGLLGAGGGGAAGAGAGAAGWAKLGAVFFYRCSCVILRGNTVTHIWQVSTLNPIYYRVCGSGSHHV